MKTPCLYENSTDRDFFAAVYGFLKGLVVK